jgi:6-pyruvoyltetrahydropterin/6-carboxytetrahydropterin synthase
MSASYSVRVSKDYLVFCAGHFITYGGGTCERLHGHNYRVACELTGPLDDNHYVFDFIALKNMMQRLVDQLDHRMLIAAKSSLIRHELMGEQVELRYQNRRWSFPSDECVLLPIENTTAELLAKYLAEQLLADLQSQHGYTPTSLQMEVEESFGQWAVFVWTPG